MARTQLLLWRHLLTLYYLALSTYLLRTRRSTLSFYVLGAALYSYLLRTRRSTSTLTFYSDLRTRRST